MAQGLEEKLLNELDSLQQIIYTFNYADDTTDFNDFESFEGKIGAIIKEAMQKEVYEPVYLANNILFNHFKYQLYREQALEVLNESIGLAERLSDSLKIARFIYLKGTLSFRFDELDSSVYYFQQSLNLGKQLGIVSQQAASINALAVCYAQLGREHEAIKYYKESMHLAENAGAKKQVTTAQLNLGNAYGRLSMADSALYFAQLAYEGSLEGDDITMTWSSLNSLSLAHYLKGNYQKAIEYSENLEKQSEKVGENGYMMTSYLTRSKSLNALGRKKEALEYAQKSLEIVYEFIAPDNEVRTLTWLVTLEKSMNDYRAALGHQERLSFLEDSLAQIEVNQRLESLAVQYETQKKQDELEALQKLQIQTEEKLKFRNLAILFVAISTVLLVVGVVLFYRRRVEKERLARQKTRNELLRSQMNPHFLFNALSSIQLFLINKGQGAPALEYLSKFAKLMRRILENSRKDFVTLEEEIATLRHYLDLQKVRFDNSFDYSIEVDIVDEMSEIKIPPMFAQPFIENSLEHGISSIQNGKINISFLQHDDLMRFKVEDNGIGISRSAAMKDKNGHESMATKITSDRIEVLKRQLKKNISFIIKDRLSDANEVIGTEVIFEIPIQY
ncbi:MAG: histidine kinase [Cytophagia bacterium]|nr:histidine kinase [Cytophagia bacterium]